MLLPVLAGATAGEGSYTTAPSTLINGNGGQSLTINFVSGATAIPSSGGLISVLFPLGFDAPVGGGNFYIHPSQSTLLLNGASSYSQSGQQVNIQLKNLPASGSVDFLYGFIPGGFTVNTAASSVSLTVSSNPESITLAAAALAVQPTIAVYSPTFTSTPTVTLTPTITPTPSISSTFTNSPTVTSTYTETPIGPLEDGEVYAYPNPFNLAKRAFCTFRFPASIGSPVEIQVFNLMAEPVRTLNSAVINQPQGWATWDGRDDQFNPVPGGLYLVRVKGPSTTLTSKFVVFH